MDTSRTFKLALPLFGALTLAAAGAGCQSEVAPPDAANAPAAATATPAPALTPEMLLQEARQAVNTIEKDVSETARAVATPPPAPQAAPVNSPPVSVAAELDKNVEQATAQVKTGIRNKADSVKQEVGQVAGEMEQKVKGRVKNLRKEGKIPGADKLREELKGAEKDAEGEINKFGKEIGSKF